MRTRKFKGNIFVANLPQDFTEERLAETFDPYGIVLSASIARDPATGKQLRHGFVDIATPRAAGQAIAALNGTEVDGRRISVRVSEPKTAAKTGTPPRRAGDPAKHPAPRRPLVSRPAAAEAGDASAASAAPPQRQFTVERRPLPRRVLTGRA